MSLFNKEKATPQNVFGGGTRSKTNTVFGGNQTDTGGNPARSVFGSALASTTQADRTVKPSSHSLFGKSVQNNNQPAQSMVDPRSVFKQNVPVQQATVTPRSLFGKGNSSLTTGRSVFGGGAISSQPLDKSALESSQTARSVFGTNAMQQPPSQHTKTLFGKPTAGASRESSDSLARLFSRMSDLTNDDIAAFTAEQFTFGCIPLKLPPPELCV